MKTSGGSQPGRAVNHRRDADVSTEAPKSAIELVMERLKQEDAAADTEVAALTDSQKEALAAVRRDHEAKVAEADILFRSKLAVTVDPEVRQEIEANHRRDLGQFATSRDKKIDAIRAGSLST
jgi:hypothetical protein